MRISLTGLLQASAVLTIVFSVVTAIPIDFFAVQLFAHFKPQYFVVSLLLCAALVVKRQLLYVGGLLLAAAINTAFVVPWYLPDSAPDGRSELKILNANVLSTNTEHERLFELLDAEAPDIVLLQEVSAQWLVALDRLRQTYPYSYAEAREGNFGIALFSRVPLASASHIDSPPLGFPTILATLDVDGTTLHFVGTHPMIPTGRSYYEARNEQLEDLARLVTERGEPLVLVGDLNASMWDMHYRRLEERTRLRNARGGFGIVPTWPTFMPIAMIPIDHVLVSDDVSVVEMRSGPRIGSDHLPLIVTVAL